MARRSGERVKYLIYYSAARLTSQLAASRETAFQSYWKLWIRGSRIPLTTKIHLYNATCVSQMSYSCNSWAAPKNFLDKLDACYCRHLRTITSHQWPDSVISNDALYKMCNVVPLSVRVNQQRWSMFGHVLRMPENTPAQQALEFAVLGSSKYRSRTGRHCSNLLSLLRMTSEKQALVHSDRKRNCGSLGCLPRTRDSGAWRRRTE